MENLEIHDSDAKVVAQHLGGYGLPRRVEVSFIIFHNYIKYFLIWSFLLHILLNWLFFGGI